VILVTGATGNIGTELIRALVDTGERVRALTRGDSGPVGPAPAGGAEPVTGDLNDPDSLRPAMAGARGIFLLPGYAGLARTLAVAREAGVQHVALLSGSSAGTGDLTNAVTRYMIESETAVKESGLAWTIVRPFGFMSNTLQWVPQLKSGDVVRAPFAGVPVAVIDPYDIAAVLALALSRDGHQGQTYTVSGPESLRPADRVRILGSVLGRELEFQAQTDEEARAEMSAAMPAEYMNAFFNFYVDGALDESVPLPAVADLARRPPRTFDQWARAHAGAF
jgi:uncharacterized protein YbjT (DUF2867 family)